MRIILTPNDSLTAVMSGAAATTNPYYHAIWQDGVGQPTQSTGSLNGTTAATLVAAPPAAQRIMTEMSIYNVDTAAVTVTIAKVVSGTSYTITKVTLQTLDTLTIDQDGVSVTDSSGQLKQTATSTTTVSIPILPSAWRVHDAVATNLPTTAAADDLAIINGTDGTAFPSIQTLDFKNTTTTAYARAYLALPPNYVAGSDVTIRVVGGMTTTVASTSCTVDLTVYSNDGDATGSADICATAAQSINSLTFGNKDFTITPTGLVAGQLLNVRMVIAGVDSGTVTATIGTVATVELRVPVSQ